MNGDENVRQQAARWVRGRALYRQWVADKRDTQIRRLYGHGPTGRTGLFGRLYAMMLRIVASFSPVTRRLERERKVAQEMRHSRLARSKYAPGLHQRRTFNRKAS